MSSYTQTRIPDFFSHNPAKQKQTLPTDIQNLIHSYINTKQTLREEIESGRQHTMTEYIYDRVRQPQYCYKVVAWFYHGPYGTRQEYYGPFRSLKEAEERATSIEQSGKAEKVHFYRYSGEYLRTRKLNGGVPCFLLVDPARLWSWRDLL